MRPPNGDMDARTKAVIKGMGLIPVIWNADTVDTAFNNQGTFGTITENARSWTNQVFPDGILSLQHDLFDYTSRAVPSVLDVARTANKYQIVPLSTCLNKQNVGPVYATSGSYYNAVVGSVVLTPLEPIVDDSIDPEPVVVNPPNPGPIEVPTPVDPSLNDVVTSTRVLKPTDPVSVKKPLKSSAAGLDYLKTIVVTVVSISVILSYF